MTTTVFRKELDKVQVMVDRLKDLCDRAPVTRNHEVATSQQIKNRDRIIKLVSEEFDVSTNAVTAHNRTERSLAARHAAVYLFMSTNEVTTTLAGHLFNRDHSGIWCANKAAKNRMDTEPAFKARVEKLKGMLK